MRIIEFNGVNFKDLLLSEVIWLKSLDKLLKKKLTETDRESLDKVMENRVEIVNALMNGTYKFSIAEKILISKVASKKKRVVYKYPYSERLVIGAIYRALSIYFEAAISPSCFSYKRGVSTGDALTVLRDEIDRELLYGVKMDISAYFNSVSEEHLKNSLDKLINDSVPFRSILNSLFLDNKVVYKGREIEEFKSLIPGQAISSFLANFCLRDIDAYFNENNSVYARYSDDILLFAETKEGIDQGVEFIKLKLLEYGLEINPTKYVYFNPEDPIQFLGLKLIGSDIDIGDIAKKKIKATIARWIKKGRYRIDKGSSFESVARSILKRLNYKLYKCYIKDPAKFGWGIYAFRYLTTTDSLIELDHYLVDRLRYLKTGKNNAKNITAISKDELSLLGYVSFYDMYTLFHADFDYYTEICYKI